MKKSCLTLLAGLALAGCSDHDGEGPKTPDKSVWELPHTAYMLLAGDVASAEEYFSDDSDPDDPYTLTLLQAEFDASGRLTFYNPIVGYDPREEAQAAPATRSWGVASEACEYSYDAQGRMTGVVRYAGGETSTYRITYGGHGCYVPVPFPVMDKPLWLLRGVASVTGSDGYTLAFADGTMNADYPETREGKQRLTVRFSGDYPAQSVLTNSVGGAVASTETTDYTWGSEGRLLRTVETVVSDGGDETRTIVEYDPKLLYSPVRKSVFTDETLSSELVYEYHADGLPGGVRYTVGGGFDPTYTKEYSDPDTHGNWRRCVTTTDGETSPTERKIVYR